MRPFRAGFRLRYETEYGTAVDGLTVLDGKVFRVRLYLDGVQEAAPSDRIEGAFSFSVTMDALRGNLSGKGIFLTARARSSVQIQPAEYVAWYLQPALLRRALLEEMDRLFPADTAGFAKALLLGDRSGIDYKTNTAFRISGVSHIIAVSGLHVSILFALVYMICGRKRVLTALLGIPLLIAFAAVSGFTPSVTRACLMQCLMLLALLFEKEYDPPTALAFAALVMMAVNPLVVTSVSFQLSVGCMAGIFLFAEPLQTWMLKKLGNPKGKRLRARLTRALAGGVGVTLSAMSLTTPLVAWYFGTVSLIGVVSNLLILWAVSLVFYGVMAVCLIGSFWTWGGKALAWVCAWLIRYILSVTHALSRVPLAAVYTKSVYIVIWLALCYAALAAFLLSGRKHPKGLACCMVLGLCIALGCSWAEPLMDACRVTVLDVGQGQSILLSSEGRNYLVDCGGNNEEDAADLAAETLLSMGVSRLDGLILTHTDADHSGGAEYLLSRIPADLVLIPMVKDEKGNVQMPTAISDAQPLDGDVELCWGSAKMTVFGPILRNGGNDNSLCILFQTENCAILITGDRSDFGERMLLRHAQLPQLDLLVAGHHGAASSTSRELLEALRPQTVIISVGQNNPYGHPAQEVLERLQEYGCCVYRTDLNGTIVFRR